MRQAYFSIRGSFGRLVGLAGLFAACGGDAKVAVDFLPGTYPNLVGPERTVLEVAVLAAAGVDTRGLVWSAARLTDSEETATVPAEDGVSHGDVNGDGRVDMVLRFSVAALREARLLTEQTTRLVFKATGRGPLHQVQVEGWDRVFLQARPVIALPASSGAHPVGTSTFTFSDPTRPAPPGLSHPQRTLVVRTFYPAGPAPGAQPAPYFLDDREAQLDAQRRRLPAHFYDGAIAWAKLDVPVAAQGGRFPVLLFSPGLGSPLAYYQTLLAELASHGYLILAIAHPGHAGTVVYPDGQTIVPSFGQDLQIIRQLHDQAALDLRALARWLSAHPAPPPLTGRLDLERLAAFGHSLGGSASADAAIEGPPIRAALNLDGQFFGLAPAGGPPCPVMFIASEPHTELRDPTLARFFGQRRDVAYHLNVAGTGHNNGADWGYLRALMTDPPPLSMFGLGSIAPGRATELIARYARALFDQYLRGEPSGLLAGPDSASPEVSFVLHPAP